MNEKIVLSWSGGKDSVLALHALSGDPELAVAALLTTVSEEYQRISMHGVRRELLTAQARALAITLEEILLPKDCSDEEYGRRMETALRPHVERGIRKVAFGDLFLEDVRRYRQERLALVGMTGVFPLWGKDTTELAHTFLDLGFQAIVVCVDTQALDPAFSGRSYDREFLAALPPTIDPCGENGEFHTFVYDGPIFHELIPLTRGQQVLREDRFAYCDLVPA